MIRKIGRITKIIMGLLIIKATIYCGIISPKYDFIHIETNPYLQACEFNYAPEKYPNFIYLEEQTKLQKPPFSNIKIQDMDYRNITAINSDGNEVFYKYLGHEDFDNDGFEEIVITSFGEKKINFIYLDGSYATKERQTIYSLPSDKILHNGRAFINKFNYDDDDDYEMLITLLTRYPKKNAMRGVFAIDPETKENLWNYYTAYHIRAPIKCTNDSIDYYIWGASAVNNGLAFSNGNYYCWNRDLFSFVHDTTVGNYTKVETLDTTASDYSNDSNSAVFALDRNGNKIWEIATGGEYTWNAVHNFNNLILCFTNYRNANSKYKATFRLINPVNGNIIKSMNIDCNNETYKSYYVFNEYLFLLNNDHSIEVFDSNLNQISKKQMKNDATGFRQSFYHNNKLFHICFNSQAITMIVDEKFNVLKTFDNVDNIKYLDNSKRLIVWTNPESLADVYEIIELPFLKRINEKTYVFLTFGLLFILIVLLFLWIITMRISKNKILQQKIEIEEKHKELEQTTSLLVHSEKMAVLGTISGSVAHEINSPLSAIYNSAQRLQKYYKLTDDTNVNLIMMATKRCKDIIDKFLKPVKLYRGKQIANPREIMEDWLDLYGKEYYSHYININFNIIDDITLDISYQELYQILTNILLNARDALLEIEDFNKTISVNTYINGKFGVIEIEDNARGFDKNILDNIFQPLASTKGDGKGCGIGLWLTKQLIDRNNGEIEIRSSGDGTLITIKLPLVNNRVGENG